MPDIKSMGTDAAKWAMGLAESTNGLLDPTPGGVLHAWLCNAIEAGRSEGYSQARDRYDPDWLKRLTSEERSLDTTAVTAAHRRTVSRILNNARRQGHLTVREQIRDQVVREELERLLSPPAPTDGVIVEEDDFR